MQSVNISPAQIFEKACLGKGSGDKSLTILRRGKLLLKEGKVEMDSKVSEGYKVLQFKMNFELRLFGLSPCDVIPFEVHEVSCGNSSCQWKGAIKFVQHKFINSNEIFELVFETLFVSK